MLSSILCGTFPLRMTKGYSDRGLALTRAAGNKHGCAHESSPLELGPSPSKHGVLCRPWPLDCCGWRMSKVCPARPPAAHKGVVTLAASLCLLGIKPRFRVHTTAIALHARRRWNYVLKALPSSILRRHDARIVYLYLWLQYQGKSDRL